MVIIHDQKVNLTWVRQEIDNLKPLFEGYGKQIIAVYLFGSLAAGTETPLSDVDIAVLFDRDVDQRTIKYLEGDLFLKLSKQLRTDEIDLVVLNTAPPSIRYGVLRERRLLYYTDKSQVVDFEDQTILGYLDFKPYREEFDREFINGLAKR
ncbi:MAG TPA: nucleotidyltransferase domain-containing protein [Bacillota bacterium]|nr:nucleotidyltransferase domain-containing protein [Bacillota bacterium]